MGELLSSYPLCTSPVGCPGPYVDPMQVSRTDGNMLYELNPEDLEVIQQMNYSAVIPVQVRHHLVLDSGIGADVLSVS